MQFFSFFPENGCGFQCMPDLCGILGFRQVLNTAPVDTWLLRSFFLVFEKIKEKRMMKLSKKTTKTIAITLLLLMTASISMTPIIVKAQDDEPHGGKPGEVTGGPLPPGVTPSLTLDTLPYISVRPNPVGVDQIVLVNMWVQPPLHVDRAHTGYSVIFTKPDGTDVVIGPVNSFTADTTYWFEYVVDQVGTWKYKFSFSGDYYPEGRYSDGVLVTTGGTLLDDVYYRPSETAEYDLVVQSEQVFSWPPSPLPTDYWTRPVSPENREWWSIAGNDPYLGSGAGLPNWPAGTNVYSNNYDFVPYVQGPNSAHIAWTKQGALSGLFGGAYIQQSALVDNKGGRNTFIGSAGPGSRGNPQIVYMGRCYWTTTKPMLTLVNGTYRTLPVTVWECFDLRTGEVIWDLTDVTAPTAINFEPEGEAVPGAIYRVGGTMYLAGISGGRLLKYSPDDGRVIANISIPVTSGTIYNDPYVLSMQNLGGGNYRLINWSISGTSSNFASRIMSNISYPFSSVGTADYESMIAVSTQGISSNATGVGIGTRLMGVSLLTGAILWNVTTETTSGTQGSFSGSTGIADHGKYALRLNDGLWHCWDLRTGQVAWVSELTSYPWGIFGEYDVHSAYGLLYYTQYDGVHAWDWETGDLVWSFHSPSNPYETPYLSQYSWGTGAVIADGKIYAYNCEHSPSSPVTRGWRTFCINATSGEGIWNITGTMCPGLVGDGYLTATNEYDGTLYVFGKGKSTTTVTAPVTTVPKGDTVLIQGTLLDMSPAQPGTPCVSKDSMTTYMEYLHMQKPIPSEVTVTGVPVTLLAVDSGGNVINIGTATSDVSGSYQMTWKPTAEGLYKVTATFAGDDSYGSSWSETGLSVGPAPTTPLPPETPIIPDYTLTIIAGVIAVIIAVAIATVLILRKK